MSERVPEGVAARANEAACGSPVPSRHVTNARIPTRTTIIVLSYNTTKSTRPPLSSLAVNGSESRPRPAPVEKDHDEPAPRPALIKITVPGQIDRPNPSHPTNV